MEEDLFVMTTVDEDTAVNIASDLIWASIWFSVTPFQDGWQFGVQVKDAHRLASIYNGYTK